VESTLPITICITVPRWPAAIEHATAAIRQVFAGSASLVVAGMVQNKDVTGPTPGPIISIPRSRVAALACGQIAYAGRIRHEDENQGLARGRRLHVDRDGGNGWQPTARPPDLCVAERAAPSAR